MALFKNLIQYKLFIKWYVHNITSITVFATLEAMECIINYFMSSYSYYISQYCSRLINKPFEG